MIQFFSNFLQIEGGGGANHGSGADTRTVAERLENTLGDVLAAIDFCTAKKEFILSDGCINSLGAPHAKKGSFTIKYDCQISTFDLILIDF